MFVLRIRKSIGYLSIGITVVSIAIIFAFILLLKMKFLLLYISILFLLYIILLVFVNFSRFEINVNNGYVERKIAVPFIFNIKIYSKKYYWNQLNAVIKSNSMSYFTNTFILFFENGKVNIGTSLSNSDELLAFIQNKSMQDKFDSATKKYVNEKLLKKNS